jgi:hypothetical protein
MQQVRVVTPFADGALTRRYTLYDGVPHLFCETTLDGVSLDGKALVATFSTPADGRAAVHGVPFGAQVARRSKGTLEFRTADIDNVSGTGAHPALQWSALTPSDGIRTPERFVQALAPAAVIYGAHPALKSAAEDLLSALAQRSVPAQAWQDVPHRPDPFWEDGTEFLNFDGDLDHGTAMRLVLGHPEQNAFAADLVASLPEDARKSFLRKAPGGAALYVEDNRAAGGHAPVPTLLIAGSTSEETAALARQIATSVVGTGEILLTTESVLQSAGEAAPSSGLALLFEGTMLSSVERNGTLVLGLAHGHRWKSAEDGSPDWDAQRLDFRYALMPFSGTWRDADLPRVAQGHALPLVAVQTDLHSGRRSPSSGLLRFSEPGALVSAIKPAGHGRGTGHPRNGILLRTWDSLGRGWNGKVEAWTRIGEARTADLLDVPGVSLTVRDDHLDLALAPNAISALWLLPTSGGGLGETKSLSGAMDRFGPVAVRYWRHNAGASPPGGVPVSVVLREGVGETATFEALVANPGSEAPIEGVLYLRAAEGWSIDPTHVYYHLEPGAYAKHSVSLLQGTGPPEARGAAAHTVLAGVVYRDVVDAAPPPEVVVTRNLAQIKVAVRSRSGLPLEGHAELIVSPRFWPELEGTTSYEPLGSSAPLSVMPTRATIAVAPYAGQDVLFRISDPDAALQGVVRIAANGRTVYVSIPVSNSAQ